MIESLLGHLGLTGSALGILGHVASVGLDWIQKRREDGESAAASADAEQERLQQVSESVGSWRAHAAIVAVLYGSWIWSEITGQPDQMTDTLTLWCGMGIGWLFGVLWSGRK